ncbi:MAG: SDR family oxidoreductase [Alphaproteobacteria bacterium]|nr:SDR family oxidoreductase [Alphaproteobacteria bacterium]
MDIAGQTVVLIGGASGIGFATAQAALAAGARTVITSVEAGQLAAALGRLGGGATGQVLDVTREDDVAAFLAEVGQLDHLVTTAGDPLTRTHVLEQPTDAARRSFEIRFWGQYFAAKHAAPRLRPGGSITFTTGLAGQRATPGIVVLGAVCGAVEVLARGLAVELALVRVNVVCPGVVETGLWNAIPDETRRAFYARTAAELPIGRVVRPEDLAEACLYFMRNGYSTGTVVVSDGGEAVVAP